MLSIQSQGQRLETKKDSIMFECAITKKLLKVEKPLKTHLSKNSPAFFTVDAIYKNDLYGNYYRYYRNNLSLSSQQNFDKLFEDLSIMMSDLRSGAGATRKAGIAITVSYGISDLEKLEEELCPTK